MLTLRISRKLLRRQQDWLAFVIDNACKNGNKGERDNAEGILNILDEIADEIDAIDTRNAAIERNDAKVLRFAGGSDE